MKRSVRIGKRYSDSASASGSSIAPAVALSVFTIKSIAERLDTIVSDLLGDGRADAARTRDLRLDGGRAARVGNSYHAHNLSRHRS
jgi:hypothetical protein